MGCEMFMGDLRIDARELLEEGYARADYRATIGLLLEKVEPLKDLKLDTGFSRMGLLLHDLLKFYLSHDTLPLGLNSRVSSRQTTEFCQ